MRSAHARPMTLALTILSLLAACDDGVSPNDPVLVGHFGSVDDPAELLATHAGVELVLVCGDYFSADEPVVVTGDGTFEARGRWFYVGFNRSRGPAATIKGSVRVTGGVETVTFTVANASANFADLVVWTLRRDEHYTQPLPICGL